MPIAGDVQLHLVNTIDEAMEMKRWLGQKREVLGLDTETSGLNPYAPGAKLRMVQIGDHHAGWAVPWEQWGGVVMECLNAYEDGPIAAHNFPFDEKWMRIHAGWDIPWARMHDTMIHYNMLYPGQPAALKTITDKHIDPRASIGQHNLDLAMKQNGWDWATIPVDHPDFAMYSALDPVLAAYTWSFLRADQKYPESFDLEMSVQRICAGMEDRGTPVDIEYSLKMRDQLEEYVTKSKAWAKDELGVSISSTQQLAKYFEEDLHAHIENRTPKGAPSVNADTLDKFAISPDPRVSQFAKFVLEVRKADKIRGSYFENFIKDSSDGLLHPSIKTMRAVTGRMSVTDPALQTLHKNDKVVRNAITARPGEIMVSSDLDQVEFRIFAHLSNDPGLIETFLNSDATGGDPFTEIGKQVYQDQSFTKADPRRGLVKNVIYGKLYGSGVTRMAVSAGVPEDVMREVNDRLESSYPGIKRYQKEIERVLSDRLQTEGTAYINTLVTNRRIPVEDDRLYSGLNYTIQSGAAEVFKQDLVRADAAGLGEYLLLPVHDEILMSTPPEVAEEAKMTLAACMTTTEGWAVPLTSGPEGPFERWGMK
jgi:DNA polymerase I